MSNSGSNLEERVAALEARHAIETIVRAYTDAADGRDLDRFIALFHPDSTHHHAGHFHGRSLDFAATGFGALSICAWTRHYITNLQVEVDGDVGTAECCFVAAHMLEADAPAGAFGGHRPDHDEIKWVAGRYFDGFERRDGEWRISHRTAVHDWEHWHDVDARGFVRDMGAVPRFTPYLPGWAAMLEETRSTELGPIG